MRNKLIRTVLTTLLLLMACVCAAQNDWRNIYSKGDVTRDTISKKKYTLVFVNKDSTFDKAVQQRMINTFFTVYPKEVKTYNRGSLKKVTIILDPEYDGVAATADGVVRVNPKWMQKHPGDIDVITHEVMHIVQSYPDRAGPGWITEGIADYVRYKFGVDNASGGWQLPNYSNHQKYQDAYRVTARFFVWIEKNYKKGLVKKLDKAMRAQVYKTAFWTNETGKTVDQLWAAYSANPVF